MKSLSLILALGLIGTSLAFNNRPPIMGRPPGYKYGTGASGIDIVAVYDLLCTDCQESDPEFQQFLDMPFLTSTVRDQISVTYTFFPLIFHHENWIVHKMFPYLEDLCRTDSKQCYYLSYIEYTLPVLFDILFARFDSETSLIDMWTNRIAT